jgi:hypothetical protein
MTGESIESMRDHGEVAPYGLALVDNGAIVDAVRALLSDGPSKSPRPLKIPRNSSRSGATNR